MRISRGFASALAGIAMTLFAWYGPWEWPAWPAFTAIDLWFGADGYAALPYAQRAAALVALIVINAGFWAIVVRALIGMADRMAAR